MSVVAIAQNLTNPYCHPNPIKILKEDADDFVDLEYRIIKAIASSLKFKYTAKEQILFFSKRHKIYDIITIEKDDRTEQKIWFEISDVFGMNRQ